MSLSSKELEIEGALKKIKEYEDSSRRRLVTYLGLIFWLCDSVLGLIIKVTLLHLILLTVWVILFIVEIYRDFKNGKIHTDSLDVLKRGK